MGLQQIGYGGQPLPKVFRPVHPPVPVLVDLVALFPREPHGAGRYHPNGLQMDTVVEGRLTYWALGEHGGWWGLVTYPIRYGAENQTVTHWVPAWVLRRSIHHDRDGRASSYRSAATAQTDPRRAAGT